MPIINWSVDDAETARTRGELSQGFAPAGDVDPTATAEGRPVSWMEAARIAGLNFRAENEIATIYNAVEDFLTAPSASPDNWNPYTFIRENFDKDRLKRVTPWISQGLFDGAANPEQIAQVEAQLTAFDDARKGAARAPVAAFLGGMAGGILSPTSLLPLGGIRRGAGLIDNAIVAARGNAIGTIAQEAILQPLQPLRELAESVENVGVAAILGGALGGAIGAAASRPSSRLYPTNPENPLRSDVAARAPGAVISEDGFDLIPRGVGADAVRGETVWDRPAPGGDTLLIDTPTIWERAAPSRIGGNAVGDLILGSTPAGRALSYASDTARRVLSGIFDISGYSRSDLAGEGRGLSAEAIRDSDLLTEYQKVRLTNEELVPELNQKLSALGAPKVRGEDVNLVTLRIGEGLPDRPEAYAALVERYGAEGVKEIQATAQKIATNWRTLNGRLRERLVAAGALQNPQLLARLESSAKVIRDEYKVKLDAVDQKIADLRESVKGDKGTPESRAAIARQVDELALSREPIRAERDRRAGAVEAERDIERNRPEANEDYFMAQMWDRQTVLADRAEFEAWLTRVIARDVDAAWLRESAGISKSELADLATSDPARYKAVMADWGGDERAWRLLQLEQRATVARSIEKRARLNLRDLLRRERSAEGLATASERAVARQTIAKREADLAARRVEREQLVVERAALEAEAAALEEAGAAASRTLAKAPDGAPARVVADSDLERLDAALTPGARALNKEQDLPGAKRLAAARERVKQIDKRVAAVDRLVTSSGARLRLLAEAADAADAKRAARVQALEELTQARKETRAEARFGTAEGNKVDREIARTKKSLGAEENAKFIAERIAAGKALPTGALDDSLVTPGRFKERTLKLTPEEKDEAYRLGYLRDDLPNVLELQNRQLAGHIALREALSIGPGRRFATYGELNDSVAADYKYLIADAPDAKTKGRLQKELEQVQRDIAGTKARITGEIDPGIEKDNPFFWASKKMRQYSFIRFGSGFVFTILGEPAVLLMRHSLMRDIAPNLREIVGRWKSNEVDDLRAVIASSEPAIGGIGRLAQVNPMEELDQFGIGPRGTTTNKVTAAIDALAARGTKIAAVTSFLGTWGRALKTIAAVSMTHKMNRELANYAALSPGRKADYASLGLGKVEAERLAYFLGKYGDDSNGRYSPELDSWAAEPGGTQAIADFRAAIQRDLGRAVITPGVGDTPLLIDKWYGSLLLQFQTFGFATVNRYLLPALQRGRYLDGVDGQMLASVSMLMLLTAISTAARDGVTGKDPMERWETKNLGQTSFDLVNRSGLLGHLGSYTDAVLKTAGINASSRFQQNSGWEQALGVNFSLVKQGAEAVSSIAADGVEAGNWEAVRTKMLNLAPFVVFWRLGQTLKTAAEE